MKVQIITTPQQRRNLRQEEFDIVKEAGKFNRLTGQPYDRYNQYNPRFSFQAWCHPRYLLRSVWLQSLPFWDRELCDLEVFPFQN